MAVCDLVVEVSTRLRLLRVLDNGDAEGEGAVGNGSQGVRM